MSGRKSEERKRAEFLEAAEAMYEQMVSWREKHPEASFDEIASEVGQERRRLMGQLLEGLATQHAAEVEAVTLIRSHIPNAVFTAWQGCTKRAYHDQWSKNLGERQRGNVKARCSAFVIDLSRSNGST